MALNFLTACDEIFWAPAKPDSFILKTAGVQALFGILKRLAKDSYERKDISREYFVSRLQGAAHIDFSDAEYRNSSGSGRSYIRRAIETAIGI